MALNKVGDGHPFATISGAIAAGDDGIHVLIDSVAATGNQYAEALNITKRVNLVGALPDQGIEITGAGGGAAPAILSGGNGGVILGNLRVSNVGSTAAWVVQLSADRNWVRRCFIDGGGTKNCLQAIYAENTYVYNGVGGLQSSGAGRMYAKQVTCVDMTVQGIFGAANRISVYGCLTYNCNNAGYVGSTASVVAWNFSDDLTAPGPDSVTGLTLGNISFVNYGAGDLRLNPNSLAYITGLSMLTVDVRNHKRWREISADPRIYGGAHTPYPPPPSFMTGASGIKVL